MPDSPTSPDLPNQNWVSYGTRPDILGCGTRTSASRSGRHRPDHSVVRSSPGLCTGSAFRNTRTPPRRSRWLEAFRLSLHLDLAGLGISKRSSSFLALPRPHSNPLISETNQNGPALGRSALVWMPVLDAFGTYEPLPVPKIAAETIKLPGRFLPSFSD